MAKSKGTSSRIEQKEHERRLAAYRHTASDVEAAGRLGLGSSRTFSAWREKYNLPAKRFVKQHVKNSDYVKNRPEGERKTIRDFGSDLMRAADAVPGKPISAENVHNFIDEWRDLFGKHRAQRTGPGGKKNASLQSRNDLGDLPIDKGDKEWYD